MSTQTAGPTEPAQGRGQAIAGALAGLAIVIVLVAVYFVVRAAGADDRPAAQSAASQPMASQPAAAEPSAAAPTAADPNPADPDPAQPDPAEPAAPNAVRTPPALAKQPVVKAGTGTLSKLVITPLVRGTGPKVKAGQTITANYVLVSYKTGEVLDTSWQRGEPFSTQIGAGAVIQGWDQGIPGQSVGSRIQLDVPAALAYGPEKGDLRFVVDILAAQ